MHILNNVNKLKKTEKMKKYCELKKVFKEIYFLEALLQREVGMSINQIMVLCTLSEKPTGISELAKELWVSLPRMSKIATDLEKQGYIKRVQDKNDLRRSLLELSAKGKKKIESIKKLTAPFPQIRIVRKKRKIENIYSG